ncbi:MAG: ABC transporter substrate-binding protein [Thermoplasmatota archaeon]
MKKSLMYLVFGILLASILATGCLNEERKEGDLEFFDMLGDRVILDRYPERIVTTTPALTEIVFALGKGDDLVGTDSASDYPAEAGSIRDVFTWEGVDLEKLIAVEPELVLMDKTLDITGDDHAAITAMGIPVYRIYPRTIDELLDSIEGIGEVLDAGDEASELIGDFTGRMGAVEENASRVPDGERPKVLHVTYYDGLSDPWVSTDSTFSGSLIEKAGGVCAFSEGSGFGIQASLELIVASDPDIILCSQSSTWPSNTRETILSDGNWAEVPAVESGAVFYVEADWCDRTGPRLILGLEEFHSIIMDHIEE